MDLNVNWRVLVLKDKSTYPTVKNKLIHFYLTDGCTTYKHILGYFTSVGFIDVNGESILFNDNSGCQLATVFWNWVDTLPNHVEIRRCKMCGKSEDDYWKNRCEYADDGYCLAEFGPKKCKHIRYVTKYWAYNK